MGLWEINTDTLAGSRFTISPLAEAFGCLMRLVQNTAAHPGERDWLSAHRPHFEAWLAADPITALLLRAMLGRSWIADFLTPTPYAGSDEDFEAEVARVRAAPPDVVRADLLVTLGGRPLPPALDRDDLAERAAALLEWVWTRTVEPDWARRRRVLEADIVARTDRLSQSGWAAALDEMRPGMRWLGGGRLQINTYDYPPRDISGGELVFVPVTSAGRNWVCWEEPERYAVVYPCQGVLAAPEPVVPGALGRLLGVHRAAVLALLADPKSTTQLVALTGQGLGSVGRHLQVLLAARLVERHRAGRSVLYSRTAAGDALVEAQLS
jgi:DNA-binding transcriptional ArsR family regulator